MQPDNPFVEGAMHFVAGVLAVISGILYAAGNNDIGAYGPTICSMGGPFCDHPSYVFVGGVLAALWGTFVSVR
jgi:hypothetical protein